MPDDVTAAATPDAPEATPTAPVVEAVAPASPEPAAATPTPKDPGLGFSDFLKRKAPSEPSPADTDAAKPAEAEGDKPAEAAPTKPAEAKTTKAEPAKSAPADAVKAEPTAKGDADDNPHKKRADDLEKRVKDTRDSFTQVTQELAALRKQNEILGKKVDGTYDPEVDDAKPDADAVAAETRSRELFKARADASLESAKRLYGEDALKQAIFAEGSPFRAIEENEPEIARAIAQSPAPYIAAMELLETREFQGKWGATPKAIESAIRADERGKAEKEITERLEKKYAGREVKRQAQVTGVGDARGGAAPAGASKSNGIRPLSELGNRAMS